MAKDFKHFFSKGMMFAGVSTLFLSAEFVQANGKSRSIFPSAGESNSYRDSDRCPRSRSGSKRSGKRND